MLTRVDVLSENPFTVEIRDARPTDSIIVEKIDGLNPPDIDIFMGDYARDGGYYGGRRVPPRTVTFTFRLNPNYKLNESVDGLRRMLYKIFMDPFSDRDELGFVLHDDELSPRAFSGYTEKFETEIFSKDTYVDITVRAPNPYLLDMNQTVIELDGPSSPFPYTGSAETGLVVDLEIVVATSVLTIDINGKQMILENSFQVGDQVMINTIRGVRAITLTRTESGTTTAKNILYTLKKGTKWLELHSPSNVIKAYGETESSAVASLKKVRFRGQHWGI